MDHRKLTKEDIDKVRDIEGFPIGSDEDIIALSDAPYYTPASVKLNLEKRASFRDSTRDNVIFSLFT